ncbi:hypothetical protein GTO89_02700 [Heliobacterium gestii]|uniref:Uncharacterized protein n=1 Tax=Heliomicrobium gestii TaxID=2699 RepID=A0A845LEH6_HELGE|nr:hypothetical protein [Heliomicrobium gestii]MBM7865694.1 hypothetical protein [Heliomicrobium gestii]MZP41943.1 hypothetical protein [Heliomicrobium gestii]
MPTMIIGYIHLPLLGINRQGFFIKNFIGIESMTKKAGEFMTKSKRGKELVYLPLDKKGYIIVEPDTLAKW